MKSRSRISPLIFLICSIIIFGGLAKEQNSLIIKRFSKCPNSERDPVYYDVNITKTVKYKYKIVANVTVKEILTNPIKAEISAQRCNFGLINCDDSYKFSLPNMCAFLTLKLSFFTDIMKSIKPRIQCPIAKGNYTVNAEAELDLSSFFPIFDSDWVIYMRFYNFRAGRHKKKLTCVILEMSAHG